MKNNSSIEIRPAGSEDRETIVTLFHKLLQHLDQYDHDMLPTRENAEWVADTLLMPAAARGEPVLIAWKGDVPIGGLFWTIQDMPYQTRWKLSYGYGTFIEEGYRSQHIGTLLRQTGFKMLKERGVERSVAMVLLKNKVSDENLDHMGERVHIARLDHFLIK